MKKLILDKMMRVVKARTLLEKELGLKLEIRGREITFSGKAEDEYIAERVLEAINFGFPMDVALMMKHEDLIFEVLNIKDYTKRNDLERIRGRLIGTGGKTKATLIQLTQCFIEYKENKVGIIGQPEHIEFATQAIISLIKGAKQANIYSYLEHHKVLPVVNLALKDDTGEVVEIHEEPEEEPDDSDYSRPNKKKGESKKKKPKKRKQKKDLDDDDDEEDYRIYE